MKKIKNIISLGLAVTTPICSVVPSMLTVYATNERAVNEKMDISNKITLPSGEITNILDHKNYVVTLENSIYPNGKFESDWTSQAAKDAFDVIEGSKGEGTVSKQQKDGYGDTFDSTEYTVNNYKYTVATFVDNFNNVKLVKESIMDGTTSVGDRYIVNPIVEIGKNDTTADFKTFTTQYNSYMNKFTNYLNSDAILSSVTRVDKNTGEKVLRINYSSGLTKEIRTKVNEENARVIKTRLIKDASFSESGNLLSGLVVCGFTYGIPKTEKLAQEVINNYVKLLLTDWAKYTPESVTSYKMVASEVTDTNISYDYSVSTTEYPRDTSMDIYQSGDMTMIAAILGDGILSLQYASNTLEAEGRVAAIKEVLNAVPKSGQIEEVDKEIEAKKLASINEIASSYTLSSYREKEQKVIGTIVADANKKISAVNRDTVDITKVLADIVTEAKSKIAEVKTDAKLTEDEKLAVQEALRTAKSDAKKELKAYIPYTKYTAEKETKMLNDTYDSVCQTIDKIATKEELPKTIEEMKLFVDDIVKTLDKQRADDALNETKDKAIVEMKAYINGKEYRSAEQTQVNKLLSDYESKIKAATKADDVDALLKEAKSKLDEVKTDTKLTEEEKLLAEQKKAGKEQIRKSVQGKEYRETQAKQVESLLTEYDGKLDNAKSKTELDTLVREASEKLLAIKTDAQLTNEEKNGGKSDGKSGSVQTSDIAPVATLSILGIISAIGAVIFKKKRQ